MTEEERKIDQLCQQIIVALKQQNPTSVIALSPELISRTNTQPDVQARAYGWLAQAYLLAQKTELAKSAIGKGIRLAKDIADSRGLAQLHSIQTQIITLQSTTHTPLKHDKSPIGLALSAIEQEDFATALTHARKAILLADAGQQPKQRVIARLTMAKIPEHSGIALQQAQQIADQSDDHNLITAVKKAIDEANLVIQPHVF